MKDTKTEIRYFTIAQYEKEQRYLQEKHREGWKLSEVTFPGIYHFEKCEPEEMIYQLDYNKEGLEHKEEYIQRFRDCGWEYFTSFAGYSYFRGPAANLKNSQSIFCDDASRLEMMKRIFRGRMLPLMIIFCCLIVPQLFSQFTMGGPGSPLFIIFVVLFILYAVIFVNFGLRYWKYKKHLTQ